MNGISAPQLRRKLDALGQVLTNVTSEIAELKSLTTTGTSTLSGGEVSYGADDSGGAGFRQVLVPNA